MTDGKKYVFRGKTGTATNTDCAIFLVFRMVDLVSTH